MMISAKKLIIIADAASISREKAPRAKAWAGFSASTLPYRVVAPKVDVVVSFEKSRDANPAPGCLGPPLSVTHCPALAATRAAARHERSLAL